MPKTVARQTKLIESIEQVLIELTTQQVVSAINFVTEFGDQIKHIPDCDAMEFRSFNKEIQYNWYTDLQLNLHNMGEARYILDKQRGRIPVQNTRAPLERVCREMFFTDKEKSAGKENFEPYRYIGDTSQKVKLKGTGKDKLADLSGIGFGSLLLLPFKLFNNPPGLIILFSKQKYFLNEADLPAYVRLIRTMSICIGFQRMLRTQKERTLEKNCLDDISMIFLEHDETLAVLLAKCTEKIAEAFQFPQAVHITIKYNGVLYVSGPMLATDNILSSHPDDQNSEAVTITAYYPNKIENEFPLHFKPEEQIMLEQIATRIDLLVKDYTHKKVMQVLENQMRQADKLSTIGVLSSGMAHELNNPLANILGYAQLLLKTVTDPRSREDLNKIVRCSLQAKESVGKLLHYARQEQVCKRKLSLNKVVEDSLDLLQHRLTQSKVKLDLDLKPNLPHLIADPNQMTQVVTNLCANAMQAMPKGGKLSIRTRLDKDKINLSIADTGAGIKTEIMENIFQPFNTSKSAREGTGLGLFVVHSIVAANNGSIQVHNDPGKGCQFDIYLPAEI